jgi:hypothetical protein
VRFAATLAVLLAACAGPKPCTRTLCVAKLDGTMRLDGWNASVTANATSPQPPVMNDSTVTILSGTAEFSNGKTRVSAGEGSAFKFTVSTRSVPSLEVSSGTVVVFLTTGAPVALGPGSSYSLPKP